MTSVDSDYLLKSELEELAEGLSDKEILDYKGWVWDELTEERKKLFQRAVARGRVNFKLEAVRGMKAAMSGKEGFRASLAVLERFAEEWPADSVTNEGNIGRKLVISLDGE